MVRMQLVRRDITNNLSKSLNSQFIPKKIMQHEKDTNTHTQMKYNSQDIIEFYLLRVLCVCVCLYAKKGCYFLSLFPPFKLYTYF